MKMAGEPSPAGGFWKETGVLCIVLALTFLSMPQAASAGIPRYDDKAFAEAQSAGRAIVIETYAPWCLPCRVQAPILARLRRDPDFSSILVLRVGENAPPTVWRRFALPGFGMLVVYRNGREVARGMPMSEAAMRELFLTAS